MGLQIVLQFCFISFVCAQTDLPKCVWSFLTESAICSDAKTMQDISGQFRSSWKHVQINSDTGVFTLADGNSSHVRYVEDLDLSHIGTVIAANSAFVHYVALNRLNLANASIQIIDDTWFGSTNNLLELKLNHNELTGVRRSHFRNLKKLRLLNLMDNNIENFEQNTFHDLNQLTHLNLRFNKLRALNSFGSLSRLQSLDLGENSINEIPNNAFRNMGSMKTLHLEQNAVSVIHEGGFNGLENLKDLNLSVNSIQQLSTNTFPLNRLQMLDLSHNDINIIKGSPFRDLNSLNALNMTSNAITQLDEQTFVGLGKLQALQLTNNHISNIQSNTFGALRSIVRMDLSANAIQTLSGNIFGNQILPLEKLFVQKNYIHTIQAHTFDSVPYVNFLSVAHNRITTLDANLFEPLKYLKKLQLQNNQIELIPPKLWADINQISELQIKYNRLTFLPISQYPFNYLEKITFEGNPWQCLCWNEIMSFLSKHPKRIEYHTANNPFYLGKKPVCYHPPTDQPATCIRDIDLVRQYRIVETYENALRG